MAYKGGGGGGGVGVGGLKVVNNNRLGTRKRGNYNAMTCVPDTTTANPRKLIYATINHYQVI